MKLNLNAQVIKCSADNKNPNKMEFEMIVTKIGEPSTYSPGGSGGKRVVFTSDCAITQYETLNLMPVNCVWSDGFFGSPEDCLTGHDESNSIGVISKTWIDGNNLMCSGVIWKLYHPEEAKTISNAMESLGASIEALVDEYQENDDDGFLYISNATFTGASILYKRAAAFESTALTKLVAQRKDDMKLNKEELQALIAESLVEFGKVVDEKVNDLKASVEQLASGLTETNGLLRAQQEVVTSEALDALKAEKETVDAKVVALEAEVEQLKSAKQPDRLTAQFAEVIGKFQEVKNDKVKEIAGSDKSTVDKLTDIINLKFKSE